MFKELVSVYCLLPKAMGFLLTAKEQTKGKVLYVEIKPLGRKMVHACNEIKWFTL